MLNLGNLLKVIACVQAFFFIYWIVISSTNNDTITNYVNVSKYVDVPNYINITRYVDIPKYINITKEIHVNITNYVNITRYVDTPKYINISNYVNTTVEYPNYVNMPIKHNNTYPATVVSAYFPLESAKHSQEEYNAWMQNFFQIEAPLVLFTSTKMVDQIRKLRDRKLPTTIITDYSSPFDYGVNVVLKDIYNGKQHDKDPEKRIHNGFLYAIWNGKSSLVDRVSRENIYNSTYFFWVDTGCFRKPHNYRKWPDTGRLSHIWDKAATLLNQEKSEILLLGNVGRVGAIFGERAKWGSFPESPLVGDAIIGTFFGGPAPAVQWWAKAFYSALSSYVSKDYFIGKDQSIMNSISIQHESKIVTLDSSYFTCGDQWFFFQPFLAHESEYNKTHSKNCHQENLLKRVRDT